MIDAVVVHVHHLTKEGRRDEVDIPSLTEHLDGPCVLTHFFCSLSPSFAILTGYKHVNCVTLVDVEIDCLDIVSADE